MDSQLMRMLQVIEKEKMDIMDGKEWYELTPHQKEKVELLSKIITETFAPEIITTK